MSYTSKLVAQAKGPGRADVDVNNMALVFLKPDANTDGTNKLVKDKFASTGITIVDSGVLTAAEIESGGIIDTHYGFIAEVSMTTEPGSIKPAADKLADFEKAFGIDWETALPKMQKNGDAMKNLGVGGHKLEEMWRGGTTVKIAPSTYVSRLEGGDGVFTINGFYPAMRDQFVREGAVVNWFVVQWDEATTSWEAFRADVIGPTDPVHAPAGSLRGAIYAQWKELGLAEQSSMGKNAVHASAGAIEGLKERMTFAKATVETDPFGKAVLAAGVPAATLAGWMKNAKATLGGKTDKAFDLTECIDTGPLLKMVAGDGPW